MEDEYRTQSISLAAFLSLMGFPIVKIEKIGERNKSDFIYENCQELQDEIVAFWNETATVIPQRYFAELRSIKARLYSHYE